MSNHSNSNVPLPGLPQETIIKQKVDAIIETKDGHLPTGWSSYPVYRLFSSRFKQGLKFRIDGTLHESSERKLIVTATDKALVRMLETRGDIVECNYGSGWVRI